MSSQPLMLLLSLALLPATSLAADDLTGFGRWESTLRSCQVVQQNSPTVSPYQGSCLNLRLNQSIEGLLTVRFLINADRSGRTASGQLTFAGLLWRQDQAMQCSQGQCKPQWPMRVQVHTVASSAMNRGGFSSQLPQARLARGTCTLEAHGVHCVAKGLAGDSYEASGSLTKGRWAGPRGPAQRPTKPDTQAQTPTQTLGPSPAVEPGPNPSTASSSTF